MWSQVGLLAGALIGYLVARLLNTYGFGTVSV
jgi:uncharacterized membrane-anchored protein YhcB (DUF1043 family)